MILRQPLVCRLEERIAGLPDHLGDLKSELLQVARTSMPTPPAP